MPKSVLFVLQIRECVFRVREIQSVPFAKEVENALLFRHKFPKPHAKNLPTRKFVLIAKELQYVIIVMEPENAGHVKEVLKSNRGIFMQSIRKNL